MNKFGKIIAGVLLGIGLTVGSSFSDNILTPAHAETVAASDSANLLAGEQFSYQDMLGAWLVIEHIDPEGKPYPLSEHELDTKVIFNNTGTADWIDQINADHTDREDGLKVQILRPAPAAIKAPWCAKFSRDNIHYYFTVQDNLHLIGYRSYADGDIYPADRYRIF